jgi:exosortase/archaeosortase family protein
MSFITIAAAVAFLSFRPLWQRIVIVASAIPIAIFCNVLRVTGQGLIDHYLSRQWAEGFAHQFVGVVMLIPAFVLILLVCWLLDNLFVDEVDEQERQRGGAPRKEVKREEKVITIPRTAAAAAGAGAAPAVTTTLPRPTVTPPRPAGIVTPPRPAGAAPRPPGAPAKAQQQPAPKAPAPQGQTSPQGGGAKPQAAKPAPQAAPQQRREQP